jgi:hypothetical protein
MSASQRCGGLSVASLLLLSRFRSSPVPQPEAGVHWRSDTALLVVLMQRTGGSVA